MRNFTEQLNLDFQEIRVSIILHAINFYSNEIIGFLLKFP